MLMKQYSSSICAISIHYFANNFVLFLNLVVSSAVVKDLWKLKFSYFRAVSCFLILQIVNRIFLRPHRPVCHSSGLSGNVASA